MQSLLDRGEKLDDLISKSEDLSMQSKSFYKTAKKTNSCCVSSQHMLGQSEVTILTLFISELLNSAHSPRSLMRPIVGPLYMIIFVPLPIHKCFVDPNVPMLMVDVF